MITSKMLEALETLVKKNGIATEVIDGVKDSIGEGVKDAIADRVWDEAGNYLTTLPLLKTLDPNTVDYTLSILRLLSGNERYAMIKEILSGTASLWLVKVPVTTGESERHCVLEYNGMYTDHNSKAWLSKEEMQAKFGYIFTKRYNAPVMAFTWIVSKLTSLVAKYFAKEA